MAARRLHHLIYLTIANCCLFLIVCGISIGTNYWFSVSSNGILQEIGGVEARYGLFRGMKTKKALSQLEKKYELKIVCSGTKGCMFSCGKTNERRKQDLENLLGGMEEQDFIMCSEEDPEAQSISSSKANASKTGALSNSTAINEEYEEDDENTRIFINFGLYLSTIAFLVLGMIFAIVSGMFALYNTYRTPIQPLLSVSGLYIWNGVSAGFVLFAMIMWLIEYTTRLRRNAAISETLSGIYDTNGKGSLGVSFWILLLPIFFTMANITILKYRSWKIVKMEEKNVRVMNSGGEKTGETILF